jgi:hypothetical protein
VRQPGGHANLSQTSTYLHASEFGLTESMENFDAQRDARGKPVAKATGSGLPLGGHENDATTKTHRLH